MSTSPWPLKGITKMWKFVEVSVIFKVALVSNKNVPFIHNILIKFKSHKTERNTTQIDMCHVSIYTHFSIFYLSKEIRIKKKKILFFFFDLKIVLTLNWKSQRITWVSNVKFYFPVNTWFIKLSSSDIVTQKFKSQSKKKKKNISSAGTSVWPSIELSTTARHDFQRQSILKLWFIKWILYKIKLFSFSSRWWC